MAGGKKTKSKKQASASGGIGDQQRSGRSPLKKLKPSSSKSTGVTMADYGMVRVFQIGLIIAMRLAFGNRSEATDISLGSNFIDKKTQRLIYSQDHDILAQLNSIFGHRHWPSDIPKSAWPKVDGNFHKVRFRVPSDNNGDMWRGKKKDPDSISECDSGYFIMMTTQGMHCVAQFVADLRECCGFPIIDDTNTAPMTLSLKKNDILEFFQDACDTTPKDP